MDVYYRVNFQLCITSGSKVSRGVQNCTPIRNRMYSDPPRSRVIAEKEAILKEIPDLNV